MVYSLKVLLFMHYIRVEDSVKLGEELRRADAVVLTYACDQPATLERLSSFWLPELRRLEVSPIGTVIRR